MTIYECKRQAEDIGFNTAIFEADFPIGTLKCIWLDAYMGLFKVDAPELGLGDGYITINTISEMFPNLVCKNLRLSE